jgi:hypothetical protein
MWWLWGGTSCQHTVTHIAPRSAHSNFRAGIFLRAAEMLAGDMRMTVNAATVCTCTVLASTIWPCVFTHPVHYCSHAACLSISMRGWNAPCWVPCAIFLHGNRLPLFRSLARARISYRLRSTARARCGSLLSCRRFHPPPAPACTR